MSRSPSPLAGTRASVLALAFVGSALWASGMVVAAAGTNDLVVSSASLSMIQGQSRSVTYNLHSGSGSPSCDITGSTAITPTVPSGVTKSPSSVSISACDTNSPTMTFFSNTTGVYTIPVTFTCSRGSCTLTTATVTLTVTADAAPTLTLPTNQTREANNSAGALVTYTAPAASDDKDGALGNITCSSSPTSGLASGSTFPITTTTIICFVRDSWAHNTTGSFTVKVQDTTAPTISGIPSPITAEATSAAGATATWTAPTASDTVDGARSVTCVPPSGSTFALGTTTVTCSASDTRGNTANATFTVKVQDTTAPTLVGVPPDITKEATSPSGAIASWTAPTATDLVDGALANVTCAPASGSTFALGTTNVTCGANDARANHASATFHVTVQDTTGPTLSGVPSGIVTEATSASGAVVTWTAPTASDLVDGARPVTCGLPSGSTFPIATSIVTCNASDTRGNSASAGFGVIVQDTTAPTILGLPANQTAEATGAAGAIVTWTPPTATDAVDGTLPVTCAPSSGAIFALGDTIVTCSATDTRNNTATGSFRVTVHDTTAPLIAGMPGTAIMEAAGPDGTPRTWTPPTATDAVDGSVLVVCGADPGQTFPIGTTIVGCAANDSHGNSAHANFTTIVRDTTAPTILGTPSDMTVEAGAGGHAAPTWTSPTATDTVDGALSNVTCAPASGSSFSLGTTTVTCSVGDARGNHASTTFHVTVQDTTAPTISGMPDDITSEATGPTGASASWTSPTASDVVDGALSVSCVPASGSTFALGTTTVSCSATDSASNSASASFHVTITDTTAPAIAGLPLDATIEATGPGGAAHAWPAPTATDVVDGIVSTSCAPASGSTFALGTTGVTCSATDAHGNTASGTFHVTVEDTTPPDLAGTPVDITSEATSGAGASVSFASPTASDLVDGSDAATCAPASGSTFALGTTTVTCTATDAHGNSASTTFHVSVQDTTAPDIAGTPADMTPEATGPGGASASWSSPTASDLVDGTDAVTCSPASGSLFAIGTTTVTCDAYDAHGNHASTTFDVTVEDTTAPAILGTPSDMTLEATDDGGAVATWSGPFAFDVVDGPLATTCIPASGSEFALGTTTVVCGLIDAHGNANASSFDVTVVDTTPPEISGTPADMTLEATGPDGAAATWTDPTAYDLYDGATSLGCSPVSGSTFALGTSTVTCGTTDAHGNAASSSFTIKVLDTTAPTLSTAPSPAPAEATSLDGATVTFDDPTASDLVDGSDAVTCAPASGSTFAVGTTTVTCSATDAAGNTASLTFDVAVTDTTPPVISDVPDDITMEATGPSGADASWTTPTASDIVDGALLVACDPASGSTFALGTSSVTCSTTDAHGNAASATFHVTVVDTTAPSLSDVPTGLSLEATGADGAVATWLAPSASDLVDGSDAVTCAPASGSTFALGSATVTCSVTDAAGNTASQDFLVLVQDTTAPAIHDGPSSQTLEATGPDGAVASWTAPSATDAVDGTDDVTCSPTSGSTFAIGGPHGASCWSTDAAGNTAYANFTITIQDTTAPSISGTPNDITIEATGPAGAPYSWDAPTASDVVDGALDVTCVPASGSTFALDAATPVACHATDAHGNTGTTGFTVKVHDTTAPELSLSSNVTTEATGAEGASVTYPASAVDLVDGALAVSCDAGDPATFALGTATVHCSATDAHGNEATGSFDVTVTDTTAPSITDVPDDATLEATGPDGASYDWYGPNASDIVDGPLATTCAPASGSTFALGTTLVACGAIDAHGNSASAGFHVTVRDTTAPAIAGVPDDITLEATGPDGATATWTDPTALDVYDGAIAVACSAASGDTFPLGTTTVECTATDAHDNTALASFDVTVEDTTAPQLSGVPDDMTLEATGPDGATATWSDPSATDLVDGSLGVTCSPASGSTFALGSTLVTCSATDANGNTASETFHVAVHDTTAPTLLGIPSDITAEASSGSGAAVSWPAPTATDAVDGALSVTCSPASGSTFALGTSNVTCGATDSAGNPASATFHVTVQDTTPPTLHGVPSDITMEASGLDGATVTWTDPTATDAVDGTDAVACYPASGATLDLGAHTISCEATDAAGNLGSASFTVTIIDTTPPTIEDVPTGVTAEALTSAGGYATWTGPTAHDAHDGPLDVDCDAASGDAFALGTTTVHCSATDGEGNAASATFDVTIVDTTPPTLLGVPSDLTLEATGPSGATATWPAPAASDLVDGPLSNVTCSPSSGATFALGTWSVTCGVTDAHGNHAEASFDVTVEDTTPPTVSAPDALAAEATSGAGASVTFAATASDLVDGPALDVTCAPASGSTFALGTTTVHCSATDAHGNTGAAAFDVTITDTTPPTLSGTPSDLSREATGPDGAATSWSDPTASDVVDGADTVTCSPPSGSTFALGTSTVTCSAADAAGNEGTSTFHVTVTDHTAPTISGMPDDITHEATGPTGAAASWTAPTASDLVDGPALAVSCDATSGATFALGTATVHCSATDAHGNVASASFHVTVTDTTAPTIAGVPSDLTVEATGPSGAPASYASPTASDLVDGTDAVTCSPASGSTFALGTSTVTCGATDAHANAASASFHVTVRDTTAPTLTLPGAQTAEATSSTGAVVTFTATASDLVDGARIVTCSPASGRTFPLGTTNVTCGATDASGNAATGAFSVTVRDTTPPTLSGIPSDITREATGPAGAVVSWPSPTASDLVDGARGVSCAPANGTTFALGTTTVTCGTTDSRGNAASASFHVTVRDTTPPTVAISGVANGATYSSGSVPAASCSASDLVDGAPACALSGYSTTAGPHTVTANATDAHGNRGTRSVTYNVTTWTNTGFFTPVSAGCNTIKGGQTVPFKFQIWSGATQITNVSAIVSIQVQQVSSCSATSGTSVYVATPGATTLRYDASGGQFMFNWQTPKGAAYYRVTMTPLAGTPLVAAFAAS